VFKRLLIQLNKFYFFIMFNIKYHNQAFSLIEVIVALGIFAILAAGVFSVVTSSYRNFYGTGDKHSLTVFAQEGIEAVRSIRDNSWQDIETVSGAGSKGLVKAAAGYWQFDTTADSLGVLSRTIVVTDVERNANDEIVASGGTVDPNTKKVTVTVTGPGIDDYVLTTYLTNWSYKTWEQSDWSGVGAREFWSNLSVASSSYNNIDTSTASQLSLSHLTGTDMSWSTWEDLIPDESVKNQAWEDFFNYYLGPDGKSLYISGTTNFGIIKYDISKAQAGVVKAEWKIGLPTGYHMRPMAFHPSGNYVYVARYTNSSGADAVCVANITTLSITEASDCYDLTYPGASWYITTMVVNAAGTKLYLFDDYGNAYIFTISNGGATLTLSNPGQRISSVAGLWDYAINQVYLDESGASPYIYMVTDDNPGEFRKMGFDGDYFSSTSTSAFVDSSSSYNFKDIEYLETVAGKKRFLFATENPSKELIIYEDQGTSLTEIGSYNLSTNQNYAEVTSDKENMAFIHYSSPGGLYGVDITNRAIPATPSDSDMVSNTTFARRSNTVTYDQMLYSTSSRGFFLSEHLATSEKVNLHFIGKAFTRATGGTFNYSRAITLGLNSTVSSGPHTDFPVVISETQNDFKTISNGGKIYNASGYDIIFTSDASGNTVLDHEIETYNPSTGELVAWIKVPSLAANTTIYMFYGNADIVSTQEHVDGVWSAGYQLVNHMVDSGTGAASDSVAGSNNFFKYGINAPTQSAGKIGRGQSFDGTGDALILENTVDKEQGYSDFTVEFWMKPSSAAARNYWAPVYFGNGDLNTADGWMFRQLLADKRLRFHAGDGTTNLQGMYTSGVITDNVWTHVALTADRDVGFQYYINTVANNSCTVASACTVDSSAKYIGEAATVSVGRDWSTTDYWYNGEVDELRVSLDLKTPGWLTTGYNNVNSPATFYSLGAENPVGYNTPGTLYSSIFDLGSTDKEIKSITVEQNIPSGCTLQITAEVSNDATFSAANVVSQVYSDTSTSYYTSSTEATLNGKRYLRYKVDMTACSSATQTPTLYGAKFNYR